MLPPSSLYRISLRFLLPAAAFLFSAIAGISVAAWIDAPNSPPNYGTSPLAQEDFRPMNLGTTEQTKRAGAIFEGGVTASHFVDGNSPYFTDATLPLYWLDLASSGESGLMKGRLGIGATSTQAKLTVNNPATWGKTGSMSDAIYAYADNSVYGMSTALSLEQGSPTGYALYSSGGINYFGGNVGIKKADPQMALDVFGDVGVSGFLCLNGDCKNNWPIGIGSVGDESSTVFSENSPTMVLPAGNTYTVVAWATYFTCEDTATTLRLDGVDKKTYLGDGKHTSELQ